MSIRPKHSKYKYKKERLKLKFQLYSTEIVNQIIIRKKKERNRQNEQMHKKSSHIERKVEHRTRKKERLNTETETDRKVKHRNRQKRI